jgi:hypothetical protein
MKAAMSGIDPQIQTQLTQLRDIDLPPVIQWWPMATGWWVLLGLLLICFCAAVCFRYQRARSRRHQALAEIKQMRTVQSQFTIVELATQLSVLLHRFVIAQHQEKQTKTEHNQPSLSGQAWLDYLCADDSNTKVAVQHKAKMDRKTATFLAMAPYCNAAVFTSVDKSANQITAAQLLNSTESWIRRYQ